MKDFVSVIIPHLNSSDKLDLCLRSLDDQTYDKNLYEVIVVDNDSDKNHWENLLRLSSLYNITLLKEPKRSSYAARNTGLQKAGGGVLLPLPIQTAYPAQAGLKWE